MDPESVAPDGSPVAFYRRLLAAGEAEIIHAAIPGWFVARLAPLAPARM